MSRVNDEKNLIDKALADYIRDDGDSFINNIENNQFANEQSSVSSSDDGQQVNF